MKHFRCFFPPLDRCAILALEFGTLFFFPSKKKVRIIHMILLDMLSVVINLSQVRILLYLFIFKEMLTGQAPVYTHTRTHYVYAHVPL